MPEKLVYRAVETPQGIRGEEVHGRKVIYRTVAYPSYHKALSALARHVRQAEKALSAGGGAR